MLAIGILPKLTETFAPTQRRQTSGIQFNDRGRIKHTNHDVLAMSNGTNEGAKEGENNLLSSLFGNILQTNIAAIDPIETPEEKLKRLRLERLSQIEEGELRRASRVAEDKYLYLFLFLLQLLPLIGSDRVESLVYFFGVAVTTVYPGGRQEVIDKPERVSRDNALYAPVGASLAIGGLYALLKVGIDITAVYAVMVTLFGALAISGELIVL